MLFFRKWWIRAELLMNVSKRWKCVVCPVCDLSYLVQKESLGTRARTRKLPMKSSLCALTDPIWREIRFTASAAPAQEDVTRERQILLHPNSFTEVDNFGGQVGLVRAKSVKVLWIFKLVERSLSTFFCSQEIFSGAILSMRGRSWFFLQNNEHIPIYKRNHSTTFSYQPFHF